MRRGTDEIAIESLAVASDIWVPGVDDKDDESMHPKERAKLKRSPNQPATLIPSLRTATSIAANGLIPGHVLPEVRNCGWLTMPF